MNLALSVLLPTHNPDPARLDRTLAGLRAQTLSTESWECLLIDNASTRPLEVARIQAVAPMNLRIMVEPNLGLSAARRCGFLAAQAPLAVLVDDDNVLAPDYLERAVALASQHPRVGTFGGKITPEFAIAPPAWTIEFQGLLALRDLGPNILISDGLRPPGAPQNTYPAFAPFGAGMVLRRAAWVPWLESLSRPGSAPTDRKGGDLTSGGDNDIVFAALEAGWQAAYFPELSLLHLIPAGRLEADYLGRLNRAIQRSWVRVLARHDACPWHPIPPWTLSMRTARAWWRSRAWRGPVEKIRWHGLAGRLAGQADLFHLGR